MTNIKLNVSFLMLFLGLTITDPLAVYGQEEPSLPQNFGINSLQTTENLSQGVLNINLPIESHLVPVSISYTTSGIRVNQRPGIVGLGWNLNAGGFVARQKRGFSDGNDQNYDGENDNGGYSGKYRRGQWLADLPDEKHFDQFTALELNEDGGRWDSEPDIYVFQFLGQSGRFTIGSDTSRTVIKLSANNLKITPNYDSYSGDYTSFTIQDEQGNEYYFSSPEFTKLKLNSTVLEDYRSKWHLTKITDYATSQEIDLSYITAPTHTETSYFRWQRYLRNSPYSFNDTSSPSDVYTTEYSSTKLLDEISYNDTKIKFTYGDRTDITTLKKLENIKYTLNSSPLLEYNFNYKDLGSGSKERLMLAGVSKSTLSIILYQFSYFGEADGEAVLPIYNSSSQDHWGFYNNNTSGTLYDHFPGTSRSPYLDRAKANSLKKVYYTSGGYDEYEYELNEYNLSGADKDAGGLRIAKVYKDNNTSTESVRYLAKSYDYSRPSDGKSSGEIYAEPNYTQWYDHGNTKLYRYSQQSWEPLADDLGRHIAYEYVTVTDIDGGSVKTKFYTFSDDQSIFGTGNVYSSSIVGYHNDPGGDNDDEYTTVQYTTSSFPGPFGNKNFKGTAVGLPEQVEVFDYNDNILSKNVTTYTTRSPSATILGMDYLMTAHVNLPSFDYYYTDYKVSFYQLGYGYLLPSKITTTNYDVADENKYLTTVTDIFYDANHPLEYRRETYRLGETTGKHITEVDYLFNESSPPSQVSNSNLLAAVKKQTSLIDTEELGYSISTFGTNGTTSKLELTNQETYREDGSPDILVGDVTYLYDSQGHMIGSRDEITDVENCNILDDDGLRVIAEVSNAGLAKSAFTSFERDDSGGWTLPTLVYEYECDELDGTAYTNCMNTVNLTFGLMGLYAYELSSASLSKSLTSGDYILGYWMKSGTVSISGASSNTLLQTRTLFSWTYEERKINMASTGTITISTTNGAIIDHLKIHPSDAQMSTYTYHHIFGKTSETDANNNSIFYEYDNGGRVTVVRDRNKDIIKQNNFSIAQYFELSTTSISIGHEGGTKDVFVSSNDPSWTVSDNAGWVSVSPSSSGNNSKVIITVDPSSNTTAQNATVTFDDTLSGKTVSISQAAVPSNYLSVSPTSLDYDHYGSKIASITSDLSWVITVISGTGISTSVSSGSGNASFLVSVSSSASSTGVIKIQDVGELAPAQYINITYEEI